MFPQTCTHQTFFASVLAGVADVNPQCLLPQCTVGYLHAEHLVDLHDVLRQRAACAEEAAGGLHTGQHRRTHIPAGDTMLLHVVFQEVDAWLKQVSAVAF